MRNFTTTLAIVAVTLSLVAVDRARAEPPPTANCSTPRAAALSFLSANSGSTDENSRQACLDFRGAGVAQGERASVTRELKAVLDARGLYVDVDALPDTAEVDMTHVVLHQGLPEVWLARVGERWLISAESVGRIHALYAETFTIDIGSYVERLPRWARDVRVFGVAAWQLVGLVLLLLVGLAARKLGTRLIARWLSLFLARRGDQAEPATLESAASPVGIIIASAVMFELLPSLGFGVRLNQVLGVSVRLVATVAAVLVLYRLVDLVSEVFVRRAAQTETLLDDQLVPLIRKSVKVFVACLGGIFVLQNFDVDVGSLLAGVSLGGLAFTLAARDTVANLFGSVSIFADAPFQVGDWVVIDGKEGVVLEVGMRSTRIRTFYSSVISIPNSVVAAAAIDNYGLREYRRQVTTLGLTYDTPPVKVQAFVEGIRAILRANAKVRKDAYEVHFRDFGASALEILVYFFVKTDTWNDELSQRHSVLLEIMRLAADLGVSFAFPTQTLHLETTRPPAAATPGRVLTTNDLVAAVASYGPGGNRAQPEAALLTHGYLPGEPALATPRS